jgi:hypothetical protein
MSVIPNAPDVRSYVSDRVFDGTRPLSAARTKRLQERFRQAPAKRRWNVFGRIFTALTALAQAVKF